MHYFDLHSDTMAVLYNKNTDFSNPNLHINSQAIAPFEKVRQCFAVCFFDVPERVSRNCIQEYKKARAHFDSCLAKEPRIEPVYTTEGGMVLEGDIRNLDILRDMGVKIFGFTWNGENHLGTGNKKDPQAPLTKLGLEVLKKLEEYGIYPDVSHLSDRGTKDILKYTDMPVIATHSNARAVHDHFRNLPDDYLKEIFARNGLVGLNMCANFLSDSPCIEDILRHLDKMLHLGGEGKVCLGGDWDGCALPDDLRGVEDIVRIHDLITRSFSQEIADGVVWKNSEMLNF